MKDFLADHRRKGGVLDVGAIGRLDKFLSEEKDTPYRFTLLMELADARWRHGRFTEAIDAWRSAWATGRDWKEPQDAALAQAALERLYFSVSRTGGKDELAKLVEEGRGLELSATTKEALLQAETLLWHLNHRAEQNIFCGFTALNEVCVPRGGSPAYPDVHDEAEQKVFVEKGLSVFELVAHSHEAGGKAVAVKKGPGAAIPVPSVVHWKFGHYSAITKKANGRYYIEDVHLKFSGWVEGKVIVDQSSGIFVLPDPDVAHAGCVPLSDEEARFYFGRHCVHGRDDEGIPPTKDDESDCGCEGMAVYDFSLLNPGLVLRDSPISLDSAYGPSLDSLITWFQRRNGIQAALPMNSSNMGSVWSHNYMEYITIKGTSNPGEDDANSEVNFVMGNGSYYKYKNPVPVGTSYVYKSAYEDRPALRWSSEGGYVLSDRSGAHKCFELSDGSTNYLLTRIVDSFGSTTVLAYDSSFRLATVTDATGRFLQFGYTPAAGDGVPSDTLKIRSITDSHGRSAHFRYDNQGRLVKSIDTIGIVSEFKYGMDGFIENLITPYGTTKFEFEELPGMGSEPGRRIKAIDPYGFVECVEANDKTPAPQFDDDMKSLQGGSVTASVNVAVGGQNVSFMPKNENLQWRNTWYWDKNAWYHAPGDYSQATTYNWLAVNDSIVGIVGSKKKAHDGRVWFNYKGQTNAHAPGTHSQPSKTLRMMETPEGAKWAMWQTAYDGPQGAPTRTIDPLRRESNLTYLDTNFSYATVKDGSNTPMVVSAQNYVNDQPQLVQYLSGLAESYTYNSIGQVLTATTAKGGNSETTKFTYASPDGSGTKGRLISVQRTNPENPTAFVTLSTLTYDAFQRVRSSIGASGYTLTYDYDAMDRVRLVTHPDGTTEQYEYDRLDLSAVKDRKGRWTRTVYTALRQPAYTIDPEGRVTSFAYCLCGKIKQLIDAKGNITQWTRDNQGRVTARIAPNGSKTTYAYHPRSGQLASITRPNDWLNPPGGDLLPPPTVSFSYTLDGKPAAVDYKDAATPDIAFSYADSSGVPDPLGRLRSHTDNTGITTYSYVPLSVTDGSGQLYEQNGPAADDTIRHGYDWRDQPVSHQVRSDAGAVLRSENATSDALGRITQLVNDLGTFTPGYEAGNPTAPMKTWTRPNGVVSRFDWYGAGDGDNALGLKEIHHTKPIGGDLVETISRFGYTYDRSGDITKWSRQPGSNSADNRDWNLGYSRAGELTNLVEKTPAGTVTSRAFWNYDAAGNWYSHGNATSTTHRTHDAMNRLTAIGGAGTTVVEGTLDEPAAVKVNGQPAQVMGIPGTTEFQFRREIPVQQGNNNFSVTATDAAGNASTNDYTVQVGAGLKNYEYDANGNLLREKDPTGNIIRAFEWDGADRLKSIDWGTHKVGWTYNALGQKTEEIIDGTVARKFLWSGAALLLEKSPAGAVTKKFYGDGEQRIGGADAGNYYYTRDHLGSIREVLKSDQSLAARYDYDAYGKRSIITQDSSYNGCDFGYTGHFTFANVPAGQSEFVLTHFRAYDPELGRWLSADPIGEAGGMNLYAYVGGNPIYLVDPLGLDWADNTSNFFGGFADALTTIPFTDYSIIRESRKGYMEAFGLTDSENDSGVDRCSKSYFGGELTSILPGMGRTGYAAGAKGISYLGRMKPTMEVAKRVAGARNTLKKVFSLNPFRKHRIYPFENLLEKYGSASEVIKAAGRTDTRLNALGAQAAAGGLSSASNKDCD
ncbi:MAG: RHS repeat-associated core domain-containing protein [Verrucomicrobiota bacterium]